MKSVRISEDPTGTVVVTIDISKIVDEIHTEDFLYEFVLALRGIYMKTENCETPGMIINAELLTEDMVTRKNIMKCITLASALKREFGTVNIIKRANIRHNSKSIHILINALKPFIYENTFNKIYFEKITQ